MTASFSLIDELETALASGTNAQRIDTLSRVTDLFVSGSGRYAPEQINLFDDVISRLAVAIEAKARAKLAVRLAPLSDAPQGVIRTLATDDDIDVARPVLSVSERLGEADLVAVASNKSQQHLAAIAGRQKLPESVTDVLVTRGDRDVVQSVVRNTGARFSDAGFRLLVKHANSDDSLAEQVGMRRDLPRQHFLRLLEDASVAVRMKLESEHPTAALDGVLGEVVGGIRTETRRASRDYAAARTALDGMHQAGRLGEAEAYGYARERKFEETAVTLSLLSGVEIDVVERALLDSSHEMVLILAKLAEYSSTTAKAILLMKSAARGMSAQDLDQTLTSYARLQMTTARRVLSFHQTRRKPSPQIASGTVNAG